MAWDDIRIGYTWRASVLVDPTDGDNNADVTTALTGGTPYIKLLAADGTTELSATAGTLVAADRTLTFTLDTTATGALDAGQYRAVVYVSVGSDKWAVEPAQSADDALVTVRSE